MKKFILSLIVAPMILTACDNAETYTKIDRAGDLGVGEFKKGLEANSAATDPFAHEENRGVPQMMALSGEDERTSNITGNIPVVSVSVNRMVSVRDILFDLADQAEFDLILDPAIDGSIIYTARNKPFDQVIAEISDLAGLKFEFKGRNLRIELDRPYMKRYHVPYLNLTRGYDSSVTNSVQIGSSESNGSTYALTSSSEGDFWLDLSANLAQIMGLSERFNYVLRTTGDPNAPVIAVSAAPATSSSSSAAAADAGAASAEDGAAPATDAAAPADGAAPATDASAAAASADTSSAADSGDEELPSFIVNRLASMVTIYGTDRQHRMVEAYLDDLQRAVSTQVLIEAKVLEVQLTDEYSNGIDWSAVFRDTLGITNFSFTAGAPQLVPAQSGAFTFAIEGADIDLAVEALSRFGTVRALASPRLTVLNNQSASLNVARNRVFFQLDIDQTTEEGVTTTEVTSTINTVPEGIIINVLPAVDLNKNEVMMSIRPSITRVDQTVNDPAVAYLNVPGIESEIPVVDVREIDTVVKMHSGEVAVIGGLMQDRASSQQEGVPVMGEIPLLGALFHNQGDRVEKYELVVLLRAVVLDGRTNVHPTDKMLYQNMGADRRPFKM